MKKILDTSSCNNSVHCMNEKRKTIVSSVPSRGNIKRSYIFTNDWTLPNLHILSLWQTNDEKAWQSHRTQNNTEMKIIWSVQVYFVTHISTYQDITCNTLLQHHNDSAQYMTEAYNVCYFWQVYLSILLQLATLNCWLVWFAVLL